MYDQKPPFSFASTRRFNKSSCIKIISASELTICSHDVYLDEICEPSVCRKLMKPFKDDLLVPMGLDQPCSFWFTEQGMERFADAVDEIHRYVSQSGWDVRCSVLWVHEMNYLYQDKYQIALGPEFVDPHRFVRFSHAADLIDFDADTDSAAVSGRQDQRPEVTR